MLTLQQASSSTYKRVACPIASLQGRPSLRRQYRLTCLAAKGPEKLHTKVCIIGSGPAAHTAAIYAGRADLEPLMFEGFMANGVAPGGQLTTTSYIENFPGFPEPILGLDLTDNFRKQSVRYGAKIFTETVDRLDLTCRPFKVYTGEKEVEAETVILATGAGAKRLRFPGSEEGPDGYWQRGISACAICDGTSPSVRNHHVAVIGGGDTAMEEATFLTRYASHVTIIHRFDYFEASKAMQKKALKNPKISVLWRHEVKEAYGDDNGLAGVRVMDLANNTMKEVEVNALFFAIGHAPATAFLKGQLELDPHGYIQCEPGTPCTSIPGVFAAGDVRDPKYKQAIVAAGSGCMAALEAERYLQALYQTASMASLDGTMTMDEVTLKDKRQLSNNVVPGMVQEAVQGAPSA